MTRRDKIERTLYEFMIVQYGVLMTFEEALRHTKGEPLRLYGADIPAMAGKINGMLDRDDA